MVRHKKQQSSTIVKSQNGELSTVELEQCLEHLKLGHVIAMPTDTVYGIGCNAFNVDAVAEIYRLKGRSYTKPLPLLLGDTSQLSLVAVDICPEAHRLIDRFWPGPLTMIFKTAPLALAATCGRPTVGVRVPEHAVVRRLSNKLGLPLAVTSANHSGNEAARTFSSVRSDFFGQIPLLIDGGRCPISIESTVIDATHYPFTVVREGAVSRHQVHQAVLP